MTVMIMISCVCVDLLLGKIQFALPRILSSENGTATNRVRQKFTGMSFTGRT